MERCQSGRLGTPGERVYPQGTVGSNPTLSVVMVLRVPGELRGGVLEATTLTQTNGEHE